MLEPAMFAGLGLVAVWAYFRYPGIRPRSLVLAAVLSAWRVQRSAEKADVFVYHELLGLKPEEIAELVDCPVNTVRSRLNRARVDFTQAVTVLRREA